jgi:hypothetical protein
MLFMRQKSEIRACMSQTEIAHELKVFKVLKPSISFTLIR